MRTPRWSVVLTAFLLLTGCDVLAPDLDGCTSEPCPDGLFVELLGELPTEYSLAVTTAEFPDAIPQPWVQYCNADQDCNLVGYFPNFDPEEVTLTYTSADTVVMKTVWPEYRARERAEECGGDCRSASIEMRVSD